MTRDPPVPRGPHITTTETLSPDQISEEPGLVIQVNIFRSIGYVVTLHRVLFVLGTTPESHC